MAIELKPFSFLDLVSLGLIDASWLPSLVPEHAARLQQLLDDPDG